MKQIVLTFFSLLIMSTVSAQNKTLVAYFSHTGENICIDCGMTRQMIYHGDNGWTLTSKQL